MKNSFDDKILVITALTVIAIVCAYLFKLEALPLVTNIVSGLLGLAIGNASYRTKD